MAESLSQFFAWAVRDMIFFSGDVQTTTIAVAITSSLCCSIVVAMVHVVTLILPSQKKSKPEKKHIKSSSTPAVCSKKLYPSVWLSGGKVHVPCVKCGVYFADAGCRFVTCKSCCFSVLSCQIHQRKCLSSRPCPHSQTEMDLSSIGMMECPERLGFVGAQLTCLNLAENQLQELPQEIGCLRGLQKLSVKHNKLTSLPSTLGSLSQLTSLDLSQNQFEVIPDCLFNLTAIQEMDICNNRLSVIPPEISRLKQLLLLDVSCNQIQELCEDLFKLHHLQFLIVHNNPVRAIPSTIGTLVHLRAIDARSCDLTSLPVSIGKCSSLDVLKLDNNRLSHIPCQIGQLSRLQHLTLDNNRVEYLPALMTFLPDTLTLSVRDNPLIPQEEYACYSCSIERGPRLFPSLKELSAREITKKNIPNTHTLPVSLQELLNCPSCCSGCGGPLFEFYSSVMYQGHFLYCSEPYVPLYQKMCSPHKPQGCG